MLVQRERQREIMMLEQAKRKIELKYIQGDEHLTHLCSNKERERRGLIRDISNIPALTASQKSKGFGARANSVQPSMNNLNTSKASAKYNNMFNDTSNLSVQRVTGRNQSPDMLNTSSAI